MLTNIVFNGLLDVRLSSPGGETPLKPADFLGGARWACSLEGCGKVRHWYNCFL